MRSLVRPLDVFLQVVTLTILIALAIVVLMGIAFRYSGNSLIWYDEVAAVLLAWITFFGAALAMNRDAHMGFNGLLYALPLKGRLMLFALVECIVFAVLAITAWAGWHILEFFGDDTMTSVRWMPRAVVQGVLPAAAVLMMLARAFSMAERLSFVREGRDPEAREIEEEIARARAELASKEEPK